MEPESGGESVPKKDIITPGSTGGKLEQEKPPTKKRISVWRCPDCKTLNELGESQECSNTRENCKFNLGFIDDLTQCIIEMEEDDFKK